jgi:RNA recognition motif-containing protein
MSVPNPTLYIHNLNDKVNKDEISLQLYSLFSTFGSIIHLGASKGKKMKGQAFITFADLAGATAAMRSCEGMNFYDKPLVRGSISFFEVTVPNVAFQIRE